MAISLRVGTVDRAIELLREDRTDAEFDYDGVDFGEEFGLKIVLPEGYHSEIPAQFIDAYYKEYQQLFRLIALIENGNGDIKSLTSEQLEKYRFSVKVEEGSSELEDNAIDVLSRLAAEAFSKMTGEQAVLTILGLAVIVACGWGFLSYLQTRKETRLAEIAAGERQRAIESFNATTVENAQTYREIIEMMRAGGEIPKRAADAAETIQSRKLRAASLTNQIEVNGVHLSRDEARELRSGSRRKATTSTITKEMKVIDVNTSDITNTTIILEDITTGDQTKVTYRDRFIGDLKSQIVHTALKNRTSAVFTLNIKDIEGDIISTEIVDVKPAPLEAA